MIKVSSTIDIVDASAGISWVCFMFPFFPIYIMYIKLFVYAQQSPMQHSPTD